MQGERSVCRGVYVYMMSERGLSARREECMQSECMCT